MNARYTSPDGTTWTVAVVRTTTGGQCYEVRAKGGRVGGGVTVRGAVRDAGPQ